MASWRWLTVVVVMAAGWMPAAAAQTASGSDKALATRIEGRLKDSPTLKRDHITVAVAGGVVTLTGRVGTAVQSARAAALSKVTGVSRVDNKLKIDPALPRSPRRPVPHEQPESTAAGSPGAATAARNAAGSVADAVTDAWIVTSLHAGFVNEPALEDSDIHVESSHHIVTLSGTVMTAAGRARAVQIAKTTKGVSQVVDTLTIGPQPPGGGS